jgi:diaminopimelate epimerase
MPMKFVKMHGCGNDYVFVREDLPDPGGVSRRVSDRHRGIGADGLVLILPSDVADARMRIFNADGGEAEMCGNGIRCVAKLLYEDGDVDRTRMTVETGRGILPVEIREEKGIAVSARVGMGEPTMGRVDVPLEVTGGTFFVTLVSMGNPHGVTFVDDTTKFPVRTIGPLLERHPIFPDGANIGFAEVVSPEEIRLRVWERGSGETQACGTGACAALVAAVTTGRTSRQARIVLPGGPLEIEWPEGGEVFMEGPAEISFRGEFPGPSA